MTPDGPLELFGVAPATTFTVLAGIGTALWLTVYVLIIRIGFRQRTYGMPMVALGSNLSCEAIFSFVYPAEGLLRLSNYLWFAVDLMIVVQILRFAPAEHPERGRATVWGQLALGIVLAGWCQVAFIREFDDYGGAYTIYGVNLLMSALFVGMLQQRRSARGQSMAIAVTKLAGTTLFSINLFLFSRDDFARGELLTTLYVAVFVLDALYCLLLHRRLRADRPAADRPAPAVEPAVSTA